MGNVAWPQLVLGGITGVLLTFLLARSLDLLRNRPHLEVELGDTRERLYVRDDGARGQTRLVVCDPTDPAAQLVITLDLLCLNRSYQPDGLIAVSMASPAVGWTAPVPGRIRADEPFTGLNVAPHSVTPVRLRFVLTKVAGTGRRGYGDLPLWSEDPLPSLLLRLRPVRSARGPLRSRSTAELPVSGGDIRRSHRQGVGTLEIHYLTKPPPERPPLTPAPGYSVSALLRSVRRRPEE